MLSSFSRKMLPLPLLSVTLTLLQACGDGDMSKKNKVIPQISADKALADDYFVEDLDCMAGEGTDEVGETSVHQWQDGSTIPVPYSFEGVSSQSSLASNIIASTEYNFYQRSGCANSDCSATKSEVVSAPKDVKICRKNGPYARTSIEGVSLTSLAAIDAAFDFYSGLENKDADLRKTQLLVLPKIETEVDGERYLTTDNLAYVPQFKGSPVFVIFPKGREAKEQGLWKDLNLWEVSWALAHEYGHHVFRTHTGVSDIASLTSVMGLEMETPLLSYRPKATGDHASKSRHGEVMQLLNSRSVGLADHWGSINEGFADLFAHYSKGSKERALANIDCFGTTRDVESDSFSTGRAKVLDEDALSVYLSSIEDDEGDGCMTPSFQDIHAVGAVIAHGVDALFSTVAGTSGDEAAQKKAVMLLDWAAAMGRVVSTNKSAGTDYKLDLETMIKPALDIVAPTKNLTADQCSILRKVFPKYSETWLASAGEYTCAE